MELHIDITPDMGRYASCMGSASGPIQAEMTQTMNDSVALVQNQSMANAPYKTGTLRRSITGQVSGAGGSVTGLVGTNVPYAKPVHEGSKPHVIFGNPWLAWKGGHPFRARKPHNRAYVNHPGTTANPFLKRALAQKKGAVISLWKKRMPERLAAILKDCG